MFNFSMNWLIFWIKGRVQVDAQELRSRTPRLFLWTIPYGMSSINVNVNDIKDTKLKSYSQVIPLILGILLLVLGVLNITKDAMALGIVAVVLGVIFAGSSFKARLVLYTANDHYNLDAPFFAKSTLAKIVEEIHSQQQPPATQIKDDQVLEEL